ncbi:MAG: hypothetical protein KIG81_11945 [Thermoguttaceae bacterium]|nr:hypothetical protein [Thermoguttaceae bacterium]
MTSQILVLGTDEAGYGPNLGPLTVGASCWLAPNRPAPSTSDPPGDSLLAFLPPAATQNATLDQGFSPDALNDALSPFAGNRKSVFPLVDSKKLFGATRALATLERPCMIAQTLAEIDAPDFRTLLERLKADASDSLPPWEVDANLALPSDPKTLREPLEESVEAIRRRLDASGTRLLLLAARRVQPREFNALDDRLGLKSAIIAEITTSLVVETLDRALRALGDAAPERALVLCDKLGGSARYAATLKKRFQCDDVKILREGRDASVYRLSASGGIDRAGAFLSFPRRVKLEVRFTAKGEKNAPTALASIVAKYLRELSMRLFNDFWSRAVSPRELRETAGYPVDAARFREETEDARRALEIPDDLFWRRK